MREHSFIIRESLRNGLAPDPRVENGAPWLLDSTNAKPMVYGACTPEPVSYPIVSPSLSVAWPHPQLLRQDDVTLLGGAGTLHTVASNFTATSLAVYQGASPSTPATMSTGGPWQLAARTGVWSATNGTAFVCRIPSNTEGKALAAPSGVVIQSVCRHARRLVLGGFSGAWFTGDRFETVFDLWRTNQPAGSMVHEDMAAGGNWLAYGEPGGGDTSIPDFIFLAMMGVFGETVFDTWDTEILQRIEQGLIGFSPVSCPGTVRGLQPHGERLLALSSHGVSVLLPEAGSARYAEEAAHAIGVVGRGAFAGGLRDVVWLGPEGDLHFWMLGEGVKHLNYRHLFSGMTEPMISYDPLYGEYWIADADACYLLTTVNGEKRLGGPMTVRPTNLVRDPDEGLVGAALGLGDDIVMRLRTNSYDLGDRDWKYCGQVQVQQEGLIAPRVRLWAREAATAAPVAMSWEQTNEHDISYHEGSFVDAQFEMEAAVETEGRCTLLEVKFGAEGKMHRRGTDALQEVS